MQEDFVPYFTKYYIILKRKLIYNLNLREKILVPRKTDLSYYNWDTMVCRTMDSPNFQILIGKDGKLQFKNKRDRKLLSGEQQKVVSPDHIQAIFFDHVTRRKY